MPTPTLYKYVQSELFKRGFNQEIVDADDNLVFFDADNQTLTKMMLFDDDVQEITHQLFNGQILDDVTHDQHFKQTFLMRFINRKIGRQTIEAFKFELISTFLQNQKFINHIYKNIDKYIEQTAREKGHNKNITQQINEQSVSGDTSNDTRDAFAELPQSTVNLDVDDSTMATADSNSVMKSKQQNNQETEGQTDTDSETNTRNTSKRYQLDELFKSNGVLEQVLNEFDKKCFLQTW